VTLETKTPQQWGNELGTGGGWEHAVANQLFGWGRHAYHHQGKGESFRLTEEQYRQALSVARGFPTVELPADLFPPGEGERFAGFEPAARTEDVLEDAKEDE
jgi:hypothetical protein